MLHYSGLRLAITEDSLGGKHTIIQKNRSNYC